MKLADYQSKALRTAQPRAFDNDYLIPMIVGEVGELLGQRAKAHWHGWSPARLREELVSEYGDVAWGTAVLLHVEGSSDIKVKPREIPLTVFGHRPDPWYALVVRASYLYQFYTQEETHCYIRGEAQQLWLKLEHHCEAITGVPFDEVLNANLHKLASRAARGVLVGSGDHR